MNNSEQAKLFYDWLLWCITSSGGVTPDGKILNSYQDTLSYAAQMARTDQQPSAQQEDNAEVLQMLTMGAHTSLFLTDIKETTQLLLLFVGYLTEQGLFHWAHDIVKPLSLFHDALPPKQQVDLAFALSGTAREVEGNEESLRYLQRVESIIPEVDKLRQANYFLFVSNCLKDMGQQREALEHYLKAIPLAEDLPDLLFMIYFQIGRWYLERGDPREADRWLEKAEALSNTDKEEVGIRSILFRVTRIQTLIDQGDFPEALEQTHNLYSALPEKPYFHEEGALHNVQVLLAKSAGVPDKGEWAARLAATALLFGGRSREVGSILSALANTLVGSTQGAEARYWLAKAIEASEQTQEELFAATTHLNIANALHTFGMGQQSLTYYKQAVAIAREQQNRDSLLHSLAQLAVASFFLDPALSASTIEEVDHITKNEELPQQTLMQTAYLVLCRMLSTSPDTLADWPEVLRTSRTRLAGKLAPLQAILDIHGERDLTGWPMQRKRGRMFTRLCDRGYLHVLKTYMGLVPRITVEWVFSQSLSSRFKQRIALEWLINREGITWESRRGQLGNTSERRWRRDLPALRSAMMRYFFQKDIAALRSSNNYPHGHDPDEEASARGNLAALYREWRRQVIVEESDFRGHDRNRDYHLEEHRVRSQAQEKVFDYALKNLPEVTLQALQGNMSYDDLLLKVLATNPPPDVLQAFAQMPQTAGQMGITIDNFLDLELYQPLKIKLSGSEKTAPILLDLVQGEQAAYWIVCDTEAPNLLESVRIVRLPLTHSKADALVHQVQKFLKLQARHQWEDPSFFFHEFPPLFAPLLQYVPANRELLLGLMSPWSAIPLEQLPLANDGTSLVDRNAALRRDSFGYWLHRQPSLSDSENTKSRPIIFGFGNYSKGAGALPFVHEEAKRVAALLGVQPFLGEACTVDRLIQTLPGSSIAHIACHGYIFEEIGNFQALCFADGYVLGQTLGALDLRGCRLAVLSACYSGTGELYGTAPIESVANYLLEAGVQTVVASQSPISDEHTASAMLAFYEALLEGSRVSDAAATAFGRNARLTKGVMVFPWVVLGQNQAIFPVTGEEVPP
jgi:tetratricopeptide (TPR) repeat protein